MFSNTKRRRHIRIGSWDNRSLQVISVIALMDCAVVAQTINRPVPQASAKPSLDQTELARLAIESQDPWDSATALEQLTDHALLVEVAINIPDRAFLVETVMGRLRDLPSFTKIALEGKTRSARKLAVSHLEDQALLARIATEDQDWHVRNMAMLHLSDPVFLRDIASASKHVSVRMSAIDKLNDQPLLAKIASEDRDGSIRQVAFRRLTDQGLIEKVSIARQKFKDDEFVYDTVDLPDMNASIAVKYPREIMRTKNGRYYPEASFELKTNTAGVYAFGYDYYMRDENGQRWHSNGYGGLGSVLLKPGEIVTVKTWFRFDHPNSLDVYYRFYDANKKRPDPELWLNGTPGLQEIMPISSFHQNSKLQLHFSLSTPHQGRDLSPLVVKPHLIPKQSK